MALRLRHFIYLDAGLVEQDLSQVRGAVYGKGSVRTSTGKAQGFGGQLGSDKVASLKADKNKTTSEETEVEFQPSPEAAFNELYKVLDGAATGITPLSNLDASIWNQLSRGDALEVEAVGTLPLLSKVARVGRVAEELSQVMKPMAELFQLIGHEDADSTTALVSQMGQYGKASAIESDSEPILNLVIAVRDAPKYRMVCPLKRRYLRVDDVLELESEFTVFGTIQRKLVKGERYPLGKIPDLEQLAVNRATRRQGRRKAASNPPPEGLFLEFPGIVLTPLAVYL